MNDLEHIFKRERLEVQLIRNIEVGGDSFGVRVDHDRLISPLAQRQHGAHAAVVKLDTLSDPIGTGAEDDDLRTSFGSSFAFLVVAAIQVRRTGGKLTGAGVDHLVRRAHAKRPAQRAGFMFRDAAQRAELTIGEAETLHATHAVGVNRRVLLVLGLGDDELLQLIEEPGINSGDLVQFRRAHAHEHGTLDLIDPLRRGATHCATQLFS